MIGIYKIVSPSGKIYVGQSVDIEKRKCQYEKYPYQIKTQVILHNSIEKYGWENHTFQILEECEVENLNKRERYWQEKLNSVGENGLNCRYTKTEDKSGYHSKASRKRMAEAGKKKHFSKKHRKSLSEAAKKANQHIYTEEFKEKSRKAKQKKVIDIETEEIYNSVKEAAKKYDIHPSTLSAQLNRHNPHQTNLRFYNEYIST